MPLLRASELIKTFPGPDHRLFQALGPLNLEISTGEFVCILGPSGCGKSTLLRILAGLDTPSGGQLQIEDTQDAKQPFNSVVFQGDSTFPWLTVHGNVEYGLRVRGVPYREREEIVTKMLGTVGLSGFAEAYPYQLSGGMRQRVALARSLANDPRVLLMDEPFGALDAQNRHLLQDELLQIWEHTGKRPNSAGNSAAKKTVVFVTHSIDEAIVLGDRVLVMSAAPGQIKTEIPISFPRPRRTYELRRDPAFGHLTYQIWEALRDEVNAARSGEQQWTQ